MAHSSCRVLEQVARQYESLRIGVGVGLLQVTTASLGSPKPLLYVPLSDAPQLLKDHAFFAGRQLPPVAAHISEDVEEFTFLGDIPSLEMIVVYHFYPPVGLVQFLASSTTQNGGIPPCPRLAVVQFVHKMDAIEAKVASDMISVVRQRRKLSESGAWFSELRFIDQYSEMMVLID